MSKILDNKTAFDLLDRLPLVHGKIEGREYDIMLYRLFGKGDNAWKPYKLVAKEFNVSPKEVEEIEYKTIKLINAELTRIFACPNCGFDLRKVGLSVEKTGVQKNTGYLSDDGYITRENNQAFYTKKYPKTITITYHCARCSSGLNDKTLVFIGKGINNKTILDYLVKTGKNIKDIPLPERRQDRYGSYLPENDVCEDCGESHHDDEHIDAPF